MRHLRLIYLYFLAQLQETSEYRGMILVWMFESFFFPATLLFVWITIAQTSPGIDSQLQHLINYYSLLPLVAVLTGSWHGIFLTQEIRNGKFSKYLLRPAFPFAGALSNNLAEKVVKFFFILPFILLAHLIFKIKIDVSFLAFLIFPLSLILSTAITFLIETITGLLAFWMDETTSLENLNDIANYTLGGRVAPIFLFPPAFQAIANLLPFRYTLSFPLELLTGNLSLQETVFGLTLQFTWVGIFLTSAYLLWIRGVRKYAAVGG